MLLGFALCAAALYDFIVFALMAFLYFREQPLFYLATVAGSIVDFILGLFAMAGGSTLVFRR